LAVGFSSGVALCLGAKEAGRAEPRQSATPRGRPWGACCPQRLTRVGLPRRLRPWPAASHPPLPLRRSGDAADPGVVVLGAALFNDDPDTMRAVSGRVALRSAPRRCTRCRRVHALPSPCPPCPLPAARRCSRLPASSPSRDSLSRASACRQCLFDVWRRRLLLLAFPSPLSSWCLSYSLSTDMPGDGRDAASREWQRDGRQAPWCAPTALAR